MGDEVGGCGEGGAAATAAVVRCWWVWGGLVGIGICGIFGVGSAVDVWRGRWHFVGERETGDFGRCAGCETGVDGALVEPALVGGVGVEGCCCCGAGCGVIELELLHEAWVWFCEGVGMAD